MQQIWRFTWMTMVLAACTLAVTTGCRTAEDDNANDNIVANDNEGGNDNVVANDNEEPGENVNDNASTNGVENDNTAESPDGAALYEASCTGCHPGNGTDPLSMPPAEVTATLEGGHMGLELTPEDIAAIAAYVESL